MMHCRNYVFEPSGCSLMFPSLTFNCKICFSSGISLRSKLETFILVLCKVLNGEIFVECRKMNFGLWQFTIYYNLKWSNTNRCLIQIYKIHIYVEKQMNRLGLVVRLHNLIASSNIFLALNWFECQSSIQHFGTGLWLTILSSTLIKFFNLTKTAMLLLLLPFHICCCCLCCVYFVHLKSEWRMWFTFGLASSDVSKCTFSASKWFCELIL